MAELYDTAWAESFEQAANAAIAGREGMFRLCAASLTELPENARVLIVGCGTGTELLHLAKTHPAWHLVGIDPAEAMLTACRARVAESGFAGRIELHLGTLASLPSSPHFDAATAILVAQHLPDGDAVQDFFSAIATRLRPRAPFFSAHLSPPEQPETLGELLRLWRVQARAAGAPEAMMDGAEARFGRDVILRSGGDLSHLHVEAGFTAPLLVFRSLIYTAWLARVGPVN